jgi:two-component system sensor histidine kinase YesM
LQPIVENCIIHGFSGRNHGTIDIEAHQDGQAIRMMIIDDGSGISAERLIEVQNVLEGKAVETEKPMALKNIQDRIRLVFGKTYGLSLEHAPCGGTLVLLRIPLLSSPSEPTS